MPNIIVKNEYGEDEVYNDVNTVKFLDESGNVVSYKYNTGEIYPRPTGNRVRFIDHDGFVLSTIYVDTGDTVYYPDVSPTREGYTFVGWNWSLEALSNISNDVDVGAMYVPDSIAESGVQNATTIRIRFPFNAQYFTFYVYSDGANTFLVDWGDGNTDTYSTTAAGRVQPYHTYTEYGGEYTVTLIRTGGTAEYWLGYNSKTGTNSAGAFSSYGNYVRHLVLSNDIFIVPYYAFYKCYSLQSVVIPGGVTSIGNYAFYYCHSLQSVVIPSGVTSIGDGTFYYCHSLQSVVIPSGVTSIGSSAFSNCYSLQSVVIPGGVTSIGKYAFYYCHSLQSIVIPSGVTSIDSAMFQKCYSMQSIVIPSSVTSIANTTIYECLSLSDVYVYSTTPPTLGSSNFSNNISSRRIHVPAGTEAAYKAATNWSALANYIVGDL